MAMKKPSGKSKVSKPKKGETREEFMEREMKGVKKSERQEQVNKLEQAWRNASEK